MADMNRMDSMEKNRENVILESEFLRPEMAFLAENPEAFGLVPDACPLATKHLLIAANGRSADGGAHSPVYEIPRMGVDGLYALFGDLLPQNDEVTDALQTAYGDHQSLQEHPVSRYCSILAEVMALQLLRGPANGASLEQTRMMLNTAIQKGLSTLYEFFRNAQGETQLDKGFLAVSMGICRVLDIADGDYIAEVYAAGDFSLYLLDQSGMAPLWETVTPVLSSDSPDGLVGKSLRFHHPEPFALLLVSESICALNATEHRGLRGNSGLVWKYRMRLENYFLRLLTDCVREYEFGDRATRFFVGRTHGRDSASGAITVMRNGVTYETFRDLCQNRLFVLEHAMDLLPNGYDPQNVAAPLSRADTEIAYIRHLLEHNVEISDRLTNALRLCVLQKFENGKPAEIPPPPKDVPEYDRLEWEEIQAAYRRFDVENDSDRAHVAENIRILRECLSEHWITLRPALLSEDAAYRRDIRAHRALSERIYRTCLDLNGQLSVHLKARRETLQHMQNLLSDSLDILSAEGNDWSCGRAGADGLRALADRLADELPEVLAYLRTEWSSDTEAYRSLLSAYTAQREDLFRRDTLPELGGFAEDWQRIIEGNLEEDRWDELRDRLVATSETASYAELFDALHRISRGTGTLRNRIRGRATENRMARYLSDHSELRVSALRGAAYEDPDWGSDVIAVMDTATRNEFRATVRRWQEDCDILAQQKQAYREYSDMYTRFSE